MKTRVDYYKRAFEKNESKQNSNFEQVISENMVLLNEKEEIFNRLKGVLDSYNEL